MWQISDEGPADDGLISRSAAAQLMQSKLVVVHSQLLVKGVAPEVERRVKLALHTRVKPEHG